MSAPPPDIEDQWLIPTYAKLPIKIVKGEGAYIWDAEGRRFIDFATGYGTAILGHCPPAVRAAITAQLDKLMVCHGSLYNDARQRFLEALSLAAPKGLDKVFLCNSGAEAVEAAMKLAVKKSGKKGFIAFQGAYHGKTLGALSLTWGSKYREPYQGLLLPTKFARYGDSSSIAQLIDGDTAAVIVEPVQGEAGIRVPPPGFLKEVEETCRHAGVLLIVDEIQSGMGRTGRLWAHEHSGIRPDIMCFGKGLASGIPIGSVLTTMEVASSWTKGEHTTTFGGNPISCAAGAATLNEVISKKLWLNAADMGSRLMEVFGSLPLAVVREARGVGLMLAVETKQPSGPVIRKLLSSGLLPIPTGLNVVRMLPPINLDATVLAEAVPIIETAFEEDA
jgi:acetylornithine/LysW-gamma-L-lysine aminotransferase